MTVSSVDELLEALLDDVIQLTGAGRGVVLLVDPGDDKTTAPRVRVSRNVQREAIVDASGAISDSIVRQVIEPEAPRHRQRRADRHDLRQERERDRAQAFERDVRAALEPGRDRRARSTSRTTR